MDSTTRIGLASKLPWTKTDRRPVHDTRSAVSLGRRKVGLDDPTRWVFNRMADVYDARPAYPTALIEALADLAAGPRVGDLGAGIGHVALPLAERGFEIVAVEPAQAMLTRLRAEARKRRLKVRAIHAAAEAMPLDAGSLDLAVVADALHFLDAELIAKEIARVLAPRGALAIVSCELRQDAVHAKPGGAASSRRCRGGHASWTRTWFRWRQSPASASRTHASFTTRRRWMAIPSNASYVPFRSSDRP